MKVRFTERALNDLTQIEDYVAQNNPVAATKLIQRIFDLTEKQLSEFPQSGRLGRLDGTRELVISRTPYVAAYRVMEQEVQVLTFLHGVRRWPDRFP